MDGKVALVTDGRFSAAARGSCVGHVGPEAAFGGPIALVRDGNLITIHAVKGKLKVEPAKAEIAARAKSRKPRAADFTGDTWRYAQQVGPALPDPVTHPGGAAEKKCHADI